MQEITFYSFALPLTLLGLGHIPAMKRTISAIGLKPRFILEP